MPRPSIAPVDPCHPGGRAAAGVDVSCATLEVCLRLPNSATQLFSVANDKPGHRALVKRLAACGAELPVVFEATHNFSLDLAYALDDAAGLTPCAVNPRLARDFAKSLGQRGKTDRADAAALAHYGARMPLTPWEPPAPQLLRLRALMRRVAELTLQHGAERNRLFAAQRSSALGREVPRSCQRQLAGLEREIKYLQAQALKLLLADERLAQAYAHLIRIKGIASLSALKLLSEVALLPPQLGCRQWTAYAGLDPRPWESGAMHRPRRISRQGNDYLRHGLFMSGLVAAHHEPAFMAFYQRLLARGKPKMVALTAVMRKLLCAVWAIVHYQEPFDGSKLFHPAA